MLYIHYADGYRAQVVGRLLEKRGLPGVATCVLSVTVT